MSSDTITITSGSGSDTLTLDDSVVIDLGNYGAAGGSCMTSSIGTIDTITLDPTWSIGSNGASYTTNYTFSNTLNQPSVNITSGGIEMEETADIKFGGRSLKTFMDKMEERLAILQPDPAKLEKFEALKKAYEHYKLMEKLCQEDPKEEE